MMPWTEEILLKIGFTSNEAKIYLALLGSGQSAVSEISKKTGIERVHCYSILEKIAEKGYVSHLMVEGIKHFSAAEPQKILDDLQEKEAEMKNALPKLIALAKIGKPTKVEVFRGNKGISYLLRDILREGKDYVVFGEEGNFQKQLPIEFRKFLNEIVRKNIKEKVLAIEGTKGLLKTKNTSLKYTLKEFLSPSSTVVFGEKTCIVIWTNPPTTIMITDKSVADSYENYFKLIWKNIG